MRSESVPVLRKTIEVFFGRPVSSFKECYDLHLDIMKKTGTHVSVATIRRIFGLVRSTVTPSYSTLNALSHYCGYSTIQELLAGRQEEKADTPGLLRYLSLLFGNVAVTGSNDPTYSDLVYHTICFMNREGALIEPAQLAIARTRNGQDYYFEQFINIDQLNGYYGNGLLYYLREKQTTEARIFGHALLALRYWLTMDNELFQQHARQVASEVLSATYHSCTRGLYYAVLLLRARQEQTDITAVLQKARDDYSLMKMNADPYGRKPGFECIFSICLLLVNEWEEALYYTNKALRHKSSRTKTPMDQSYFQTYRLVHAMAVANLGKREKATELFDEIDPNGFHFLAKKFHTCLYLKLGCRLNKIKKGEEQVLQLIHETGFDRIALTEQNRRDAASKLNKIEQYTDFSPINFAPN